MNEMVTAMILSLLDSSQKHIVDAGMVRNGGNPDSVWISHMVTAMLLRATADALQAARDKFR